MLLSQRWYCAAAVMISEIPFAMRKLFVVLSLICAILLFADFTPTKPPLFTFSEVMIPMRDGVRLQTVIVRPLDKTGSLPILLQRTPYGVPDKAPDPPPPNWKELSQDGYIMVMQNLRGRFKSEGVFQLSSWVDLNNPKAINETTDAYDTIDWLVKNVPNNNGRVGIFGVSY